MRSITRRHCVAIGFQFILLLLSVRSAAGPPAFSFGCGRLQTARRVPHVKEALSRRGLTCDDFVGDA
jgi:hypothetical protein